MSACVNRPLSGRLGPFLQVRPGERPLVAYLLGLFFLIGAGLAVGRGTTDALFFKRYGIEYLPVMYMAFGLLLGAVSVVYAAFVDRLPAERTLAAVCAVVAGVVGLAWWGMAASGASALYPAYFLIYEVASEILLVHGALYLAQNLDTLAAKRLSPLVFAGAQVGTIGGGLFLGVAAPLLGVHNLLLVWSALLVAVSVLLYRWHARHGTSALYRAPRRREPLRESLAQVTDGVRLVRDSSLVRYGSAALFFLVVSFYVLCYSVNRVYNETFASEAALTAFFGSLTAATSTLALALQVLVTGPAIGRFGLRRVNLVFPTTTLLSYAGLIVHFGLAPALAASVNKDAIMPGVRNPVRAVFFNVLPPAIQGRARAVSVMLVMPAALVVCGGLLWVLQRLEDPLQFLVPGAVAAALYGLSSWRMNGAYVDTLLGHLKARLSLPEDALRGPVGAPGERMLEALAGGVRDPDEEVAIASTRALAAADPGQAATPVLERLRTMGSAGADRLVRALPRTSPALAQGLLERARQGDPHLRATVLEALSAQRAEPVRPHVAPALRSDNPRLAAAGVHAALTLPVEALVEEALSVWRRLLEGPSTARLAAVRLVGDLDRLAEGDAGRLREVYRRVLPPLLEGPDEQLSARVLHALAAWSGPPLVEIGPSLERLAGSGDPRVRAAAGRCAGLLAPGGARDALVLQGLEDGHQQVRDAVLGALGGPEDPSLRGLAERWVLTEGRGSPRAHAALLEALGVGELPVPWLAAVARAKVADALRLGHALDALERSPEALRPGPALLAQVVRERLRQTVDLALIALAPAADEFALAAIRAALGSGDPRHVANACEALGNLDGCPEAAVLARLVCGREGSGRAGAGGPFADALEAARWCAGRADPWLAACARHALEGVAGGGGAP
jgi:hypothetical protein